MREHFHNYKRNHRRAILATGMFVLLFLTVAIAGWMGMRPDGIWIIAGFFVIATFVMEAAFGQH